MSLYFVSIIQAFLPLAAFAALIFSLLEPTSRKREERGSLWVAALFILAGYLLYGLAASMGIEPRVRTLLRLLSVSALLVSGLLLLMPSAKGANKRPDKSTDIGPTLLVRLGIRYVIAMLALQGAFDVRVLLADQSFTATSVLNTELFLNSAAVVVASALMIVLPIVIAHIGSRSRRLVFMVLCVSILAFAIIWLCEALLGAMQMGLLGVTSTRVSIVAKVTNYAQFKSYLLLALLFILSVGFLLSGTKRPQTSNATTKADLTRADLRKYRATRLNARRWLAGSLALIVFSFVSLLYQDLYASRPPTLSAAADAVPDEQGEIHIAIDAVKDGNLHRYAYIAEDGHRVRFFLINRYDEQHVKIGVVYDACMICGDAGYIQKGNDVICVACNVRIFIPSIGKAGGCNPIPLQHHEDQGDIVIAASELEHGARYFSEVVAIEVIDPVTKEKLINLEAPYQYDFKGKTFFFGSKESYETFREAPESYAGSLKAQVRPAQGRVTL
ncbi:Fe-S-containing protein [uncultured Cohaesibacter sp.]|uniref:Fe-S-containing protein n=1 Tax=uncultured Cohaesibacter sp. TaxID=1002546 RepID=UPI002AAB1CFF|nr:Fe-S-containing protein [uncultured Cohaesibacter sp.]